MRSVLLILVLAFSSFSFADVLHIENQSWTEQQKTTFFAFVQISNPDQKIAFLSDVLSSDSSKFKAVAGFKEDSPSQKKMPKLFRIRPDVSKNSELNMLRRKEVSQYRIWHV